jgi:hypothetical protein
MAGIEADLVHTCSAPRAPPLARARIVHDEPHDIQRD